MPSLFCTLCLTPGALEEISHRACPQETYCFLRTQVHKQHVGCFGGEHSENSASPEKGLGPVRKFRDGSWKRRHLSWTLKADKDSSTGLSATILNSSIKIELILFIFLRIWTYGRGMIFVVILSSFLILSTLSLFHALSPDFSKTILVIKVVESILICSYLKVIL